MPQQKHVKGHRRRIKDSPLISARPLSCQQKEKTLFLSWERLERERITSAPKSRQVSWRCICQPAVRDSPAGTRVRHTCILYVYIRRNEVVYLYIYSCKSERAGARASRCKSPRALYTSFFREREEKVRACPLAHRMIKAVRKNNRVCVRCSFFLLVSV